MTVPDRARELPARRVVDAVGAWARRRADVRAAALVGSWARRTARMDSDLDVVVLVDDVAVYIDSDEWVREMGAVGILRTQRWGVLTERRLQMPDDVVLDLGIAPSSWAATTPVDAGTARVVADGLVPVHDPGGLLAALTRGPAG